MSEPNAIAVDRARAIQVFEAIRHPDDGRGFTYDPDLPDTEDGQYLMLLPWRWHPDNRVWQAHSPRHRTTVTIHRLVLGDPRDSRGRAIRVDHIDGDPMDIRRSSLRLATDEENSRNVRHRNSAASPGVTYDASRKSYRACVTHLGKQHRKRFTTLKAAIAWRNRNEVELHGEFAQSLRGLPVEARREAAANGGYRPPRERILSQEELQARVRELYGAPTDSWAYRKFLEAQEDEARQDANREARLASLGESSPHHE